MVPFIYGCFLIVKCDSRIDFIFYTLAVL